MFCHGFSLHINYNHDKYYGMEKIISIYFIWTLKMYELAKPGPKTPRKHTNQTGQMWKHKKAGVD
jgi:hypothetical protein